MSERYQIQARIGEGGLGAVFRAFDTQLKRLVAVKRVLAENAESEEQYVDAARRLSQEAGILSSLNHPNIVSIFDFGKDDSGEFVVMELLEGETLESIIGNGLLSLEDFAELVTQIMEGMIAAQAVDLLHRDLKPGNIMIIQRGNGAFLAKILDFGLAKFSPKPMLQTIDSTNAIIGSVYYMAPEQFERKKLDFRTDMYALGCIFYFTLTGRHPFDGVTAAEVMTSHLSHRVRPLGELRPDLPKDVCQWVMWLMNREMRNRPESANSAVERFPISTVEAAPSTTLRPEPFPVEPGPIPKTRVPSRSSETTTRKVAAKSSTNRDMTILVVVVGIGLLVAGIAALLLYGPFW